MEKCILCVAGTRPEIIKMAPVVRALRATHWAKPVVAASGQHRELAERAFAAFGLSPDLDLAVMTENQTLSSLTGRLFLTLEPQLRSLAPDLVIAQGDTTTVMAVATSCFYLGIPFAHLEAGLRTGNLQDPFPEEFNRVVCGHLAGLHFAPTATARRALISEGIPADKVVVTGNTVIDALLATKGAAPAGIDAGRKLILMTAHRRENFGAPLERIFLAIRDVLKARDDVQLLYPVHPNPNVAAMADKVFKDVPGVVLSESLDYVSFVGAMQRAHHIVSDSGGVQEEAPALGKPVLVIRNETERPEAVAAGAARLVGTTYERVRGAIEELLDNETVYRAMARGVSPFGDGRAAARVVDALEVFFQLKKQRGLSDFDVSAASPRAE